MRRRFFLCAACAAACLTPLSAQAPAPNLMQNGDLEAALPAGAVLPSGWSKFGKEGSAYKAEVAPEGRFGGRALRVESMGEYAGVDANRLDVQPGKRYAARVWVRVDAASKGSAWIKLDYTGKDGKWLGDSKSGIGVKPAMGEWQVVTLVARGDLYPDAAKICLAVGCSGQSVALFDDMEVLTREADPPGNLLADGGMEWVIGELPSKWGLSQAAGGTVQRRRRTVPVREGWYSLQLVGKASWVASDTTAVPLDPAKKYTLTGWVRARVGKGTVKINYLQDGKYLGQTDSPPVTANTWTQTTVQADLAKYPQATHLGAGCFSSGGDCDVLFDDLSLRAE